MELAKLFTKQAKNTVRLTSLRKFLGTDDKTLETINEYRPCQLQNLDISSNGATERGIVALLYGLMNGEASLARLIARGNHFAVTPRLLSVLGDLLVYRNSTLKVVDLLPKKRGIDKKSPKSVDLLGDICVQKNLDEVVPDWSKWVRKNSNVQLLLV